MTKDEATAYVKHLNDAVKQNYELAVSNWLANADQRRSYKLPPLPFPEAPLAWHVEHPDPNSDQYSYDVVKGPELAVTPAFNWGDFGVINTPEKPHLKPTPSRI